MIYFLQFVWLIFYFIFFYLLLFLLCMLTKFAPFPHVFVLSRNWVVMLSSPLKLIQMVAGLLPKWQSTRYLMIPKSHCHLIWKDPHHKALCTVGKMTVIYCQQTLGKRAKIDFPLRWWGRLWRWVSGRVWSKFEFWVRHSNKRKPLTTKGGFYSERAI